jgi:hypothetical protein
MKAARRIGDPLLSDLGGRVSFASLRWNYDTRNNSQIPTRGIDLKNSLNYYFDSLRWSNRNGHETLCKMRV